MHLKEVLKNCIYKLQLAYKTNAFQPNREMDPLAESANPMQPTLHTHQKICRNYVGTH